MTASPELAKTPNPTAMSMFLSYVREDEDYRKTLVPALTSPDLQVHGDWLLESGIEYLNQIARLIEQSDVFMVLLSPESMSTEVRREVEAAVSLGKRILPVVVSGEPNTEEMPAVLRSLQWTFLRAEAFDSSIELILRSIYSDFDDLRQHTELLLAALRWQRANQDSALLLRGGPLEQAGLWFDRVQARGAKWYPQATEVQRLYYQASVHLAKRRRVITVAAGLLLAIAIVVVGIRYQGQKQLATTAENARKDQQAIKHSQDLAQEALTKIPYHRDEALRLADEALRSANTKEAAAARREISMLRGAIDAKFEVGAVQAVGFANNGGIVALGSGNIVFGEHGRQEAEPVADIWIKCEDLGSPQEARYRASYLLSLPGVKLRALASSPGAHWIAGADTGHLYAWNLTLPSSRQCDGLNIVDRPRTPPLVFADQGTITAIALSPDGTLVAAGDANGTTVIRALPSGKVMRKIDHESGKSVIALAFSEDEKKIAIATQSSAVFVEPASDRPGTSKPWGITVLDRPRTVAFHPGGKVFATATDRRIVISSTGADFPPVQETLDVHTRPVNALLFSADGKYLVSGSDDQTVRVWDLQGIEDPNLFAKYPRGNARLLMTLTGHTSSVNALALASDGDLFASGGEDGTIVLRAFDGLTAPLPAPTPQPASEQPAKPLPSPSPSEEGGEPAGQVAPKEEQLVYIHVGKLNQNDFKKLESIMAEDLVGSVSGQTPDGGVTYLNTGWIARPLATKIQMKLKRAGIPAELRTENTE